MEFKRFLPIAGIIAAASLCPGDAAKIPDKDRSSTQRLQTRKPEIVLRQRNGSILRPLDVIRNGTRHWIYYKILPKKPGERGPSRYTCYWADPDAPTPRFVYKPIRIPPEIKDKFDCKFPAGENKED